MERWLMGSEYQISIAGKGIQFRCRDDEPLLRGALRSGVGMAYECGVGNCGTCKFELLSGEVSVLWAQAPGLSPRDVQRGRRLACQSVPQCDSTVRISVDDYFVPKVRPGRFAATLEAVRSLTSNMREFIFKSEDAARFLPGQYALLHLAGVQGPRAYSMSNVENDSGVWEFIIREAPAGPGTRVLFHDMKPGSRIELEGPYGMAYLRTDIRRHVVCIAGGSGIGPMLSIARAIAVTPAMSDIEVDFFYGCRHPRQLCGQEELARLPGFGHRLRFHPSVSDPDGISQSQWQGLTGNVHDCVASILPPQRIRESEYYVCGPAQMVQATTEMLSTQWQVLSSAIHYDKFF